MDEVRCDYVLVGLGLAGTALAASLLARGKRIAVIHNPTMHSSSSVAAGLYNPVTGRKMVKTWNADTLFPSLKSFYKQMEEKTGQKFLTERPIYRPFLSIEEQNDWAGRSATDEYRSYISQVYTESQLSWVKDPEGGILLDQAGYLDTSSYLKAMHSWIFKSAVASETSFNSDNLVEEDGRIRYKSLTASKIIFCEGTYVVDNTWFNWLPFRPVKGEILDIELPYATEWIVNRGVFMLDRGNGIFRVGSTYNNSDNTWEPTDSGRDAIKEKLSQLINCDFSIVNQYAGVRPASKDRRPIIGIHPSKETFVILNGLGTKGVSLAPYYANQLAGYLGGENDLDSEVSINRYISLY